ncbi:MAG: hypothetical protein ORO03_03050, partial [Alphaproteobacteria bacterium]|nr:hypothetical protein [Alphaproteobacteria bacterium]
LTLGLAAGLEVRGPSPPPLSVNAAVDAGIRVGAYSVLGEFRWTPPVGVATDKAGREQVRAMQYVGAVVPCWHIEAYSLCGVIRVTAAAVTSPLSMAPAPLATLGVAVGGRVGGDVLTDKRGLLHGRISVDALGVIQNATLYYNDLPLTPSGPGIAVVLSAGVVADLSIK